MKRGEVWWANLPSPTGRRPVLLLSRNKAYAVRAAVTVAQITRTVRGIPVEVPLDQKDGMPVKCVVNLDTLMTIPKSLLEKPLTSLSAAKMQLVKEALQFALDLY